MFGKPQRERAQPGSVAKGSGTFRFAESGVWKMDRRKFIAAAALSAASTTALTNRADAAVLNPIAARILAKLGWGVLGGIGGYFGNQIARHIESWVIGQWQQPVPAQPPIWWGQNGLGLNGHIPQAPQYWQPQSFLGGWNGPWRHAPPAAPNNFAADVVTTLWLEAETNQIYRAQVNWTLLGERSDQPECSRRNGCPRHFLESTRRLGRNDVVPRLLRLYRWDAWPKHQSADGAIRLSFVV